MRIDTDLRELDMAAAGIDLAVRFGSGGYPGNRVDHLMGEELVPVCSPSLLQGRPPLRTPEDLEHLTLLHIESESRDPAWADWPAWLEAAGYGSVEGRFGPKFSQSLMAVQAAIEGQGVALASRSIMTLDIAEGRLLRLFGDVGGMPTRFAFYVVSSKRSAGRQEVSAFRDWMIAEARR